LGLRIGPPVWLRSGEGRLKILCDLEKWKTSDFPYSIASPSCLSKEEMML